MNWDDIEKQLHGYEDTPHPVDTDRLWGRVQPHIPRHRDDHPLMLVIFGLLCMTCMSWMYINAHTASNTPVTPATPIATETLEYATVAKEHCPEYNDIVSMAEGTESHSTSANEVSATASTVTKDAATNYELRLGSTVYRPRLTTDLYTSPNSIESHNINQPKSGTASPIYLAETHGASYDHTPSRSEAPELGILGQSSISPLAWEVDLVAPQSSTILPLLQQQKLAAYAELQGAISYGHGDLSPRQEVLGYQAAGRSNESSLPSYGLGLSVGVRWANHWSLQTGIRYAHLYKYSKATLNISESIEVDDAPTTQIITANDTRTILGSVTATQEFTRDAQRLVQYGSLQIPLTLIYGTDHKLWGWDIGLGAAHSIPMSRSGHIHLGDNEEYDISVDPQGLYSSNGSWSMHGLAGVRYHIGHGIDLYARARYEHYLTSISSGASPWRETLSGAHMDIGLRYHL